MKAAVHALPGAPAGALRYGDCCDDGRIVHGAQALRLKDGGTALSRALCLLSFCLTDAASGTGTDDGPVFLTLEVQHSVVLSAVGPRHELKLGTGDSDTATASSRRLAGY